MPNAYFYRLLQVPGLPHNNHSVLRWRLYDHQTEAAACRLLGWHLHLSGSIKASCPLVLTSEEENGKVSLGRSVTRSATAPRPTIRDRLLSHIIARL